MDSLYSEAIRNYIRQQNWPKGLIIETVEYNEEGCLRLRLYQDNLQSIGVDREWLHGKLIGVAHAISNMGVPCFLELVEGNGR